jgi:hypothetical protein
MVGLGRWGCDVSFEFPHLPDTPERADHRFKDKIQASAWSEVVQTINHGFGTTGPQLGAWSWGSGGWQTSSSSYTTTNSASGVDLDQINPVVTPSRELLLGCDGDCIVEFEAVGSDVDLEIKVYDDTGTLQDTLEISCGATTEDRRAYSKLAPGTYRLALRGRTSGSTGIVYQVAARELPLENLCFDAASDCGVNGGFWVGQYADGDNVSSWDNEGTGGDFLSDDPPAMNRDALATGVHAGTFDVANAEFMETEGTFELSDTNGFLLGCAMKPTGTESYMIGLTKNRSSGYASYVGFQYSSGDYILRSKTYTSSTNYTLTHNLGASPGWIDGLIWWDGDVLRLISNGEFVDTASTAGTLLTGDDTAVLGALSNSPNFEFDGDLSMPVVVGGAFSRRDVDRFIQWRRAIHGIY